MHVYVEYDEEYVYVTRVESQRSLFQTFLCASLIMHAHACTNKHTPLWQSGLAQTGASCLFIIYTIIYIRTNWSGSLGHYFVCVLTPRFDMR